MTQNALNAQSLTLDLRVAKTKTSKVKWQCGFTHLTQVLMASSGVLSQGGQESIQGAVLIITDDKYTSKHHMAVRERKLKKKQKAVSSSTNEESPVKVGGQTVHVQYRTPYTCMYIGNRHEISTHTYFFQIRAHLGPLNQEIT